MNMYKIQVGNFPLCDSYTYLEAQRIKSKLQPCVNDEVKLIPVEEPAQLAVIDGGVKE
ncbi:hypothetical protein PN4B1_16790 [Paenibacillus naphthalenovorans]|nr:hypothetical protein PN4B1_16790 [Paenibacillus naphthalenovorans]